MTLASLKKIFTLTENENGYIISKYRSKEPIVEIPAYIDDKPVIAIGEMAFKGKDIEEITIPDTVTLIGERAFCECKKLNKITLPKDAKIDHVAFYDCSNLADEKGFVIVNNILFRYMGSDKDAIIPDGVVAIDNGAFERSKTLESITIPNSVKFIGNAAFYGCRKLSSVKILNLETDIHRSAFESCPKLLDKNGFVIFTDYLYQYLGEHEHVTIPDTVKTIGEGAFPYSKTIKSITIPPTVTTIGTSAFMRTSAGLESVIIPDSVISIGPKAFAMCDKVTITAPKGSYAVEYAIASNIPYIEI